MLYANLSDKDGGAIIAQLSQMNVPYRHADGGAAILVPVSKVHDARLKLAAGPPKGSVVGYELMDGARFGQTQFQGTPDLPARAGRRADALHHRPDGGGAERPRAPGAAQPERFFREQQSPRLGAADALPGRTLDRAQIAGIVHLVSSSVPG